MFVLVGCGSAKRKEPCAARNLYTGSLFRYRRRYAERFGTDGWRIVSAKYGLVHPDTVIEPYDLRVEQLTPLEQSVWADGIGEQLRRLHYREVEVHAGKAYRDLLKPWLVDAQAPLAHLGMFDQFGWYRDVMGQEGIEPSTVAL